MTQSVGSSIENIIKDFINYSPENTLKNDDNDKAFGAPLVGFSRGDDPLYPRFRIQNRNANDLKRLQTLFLRLHISEYL